MAIGKLVPVVQLVISLIVEVLVILCLWYLFWYIGVQVSSPITL